MPPAHLSLMLPDSAAIIFAIDCAFISPATPAFRCHAAIIYAAATPLRRRQLLYFLR
jgi:hypothetical protein